MEVDGRLVLFDVEHVVDGDDADQFVEAVADRQGEQVVVPDDPGRLLARGAGAHVQHVAMHQVADARLGFGEDQVFQRDETDQMPACVDDVQVVDGLLARGDLAHVGQRLDRGQLGRDRRELGAHDRTDRALGVFGEALGLPADALRQQGQQLVLARERQTLDEVGAVVGGHRRDERGDGQRVLLRGQRHLPLARQVAEGLRGVLEPVQAEDGPGRVVGQAFQDGRDAVRVRLEKGAPDGSGLAGGQHLRELFGGGEGRHGGCLLRSAGSTTRRRAGQPRS